MYKQNTRSCILSRGPGHRAGARWSGGRREHACHPVCNVMIIARLPIYYIILTVHSGGEELCATRGDGENVLRANLHYYGQTLHFVRSQEDLGLTERMLLLNAENPVLAAFCLKGVL